MKLRPSERRGGERGLRFALSSLLLQALLTGWCAVSWAAQNPPSPSPSSPPLPTTPSPAIGPEDSIGRLQGLPIRRISFEGVAASRVTSLRDHLPLKEGAPFSSEELADSLRQLYGSGLFASIQALGEREGDGVALVFRGVSRMFVGTVEVDGAKGANVNAQLERISRLNPGTRFTDAKLKQALELMHQVMEENGYYQPTITETLDQHADQQLVNVSFHVESGKRARVGAVSISGESGLSLAEFRRHAHLREGALVDHDTVNQALSGLLKYYRGQQRFEAEIKLQTRVYAAGKVDYGFTATEGPRVQVIVEGASLPEERIKRLIPVFEEGTVDDDLLNEGNRRVRDYFQSLGYFDVKVDHLIRTPLPGNVRIVYDVRLGTRGRVESVKVDGNHYFDSSTLEEMLGVHSANLLDRHGVYSQALVAADVSALQAVYQNNGFSNAKITPEVGPARPAEGSSRASTDGAAPLRVIYHIEEGPQQRVGSVQIEGNDHVGADQLLGLMNTSPGQLLSPRNLAGDRDALSSEYLNRGFEQVHIDVEQKEQPGDSSKVDVVFHVTEGKQIFVRNVVLTGLHFTRPSTVQRAITVHPGDPLSQTALQDTQRNLYELALFNEVSLAVQNPAGGETDKTVLLQTTEARRWTLTYGAGFEAQTGTPVNGCQGYINSGVKNCTPNGRTGISPRVLMAITRNNVMGREQSVSLQGNYGLLEQKIDLIFQNPHLHGKRNFGLTFTGGYANSLDVTTYVASRLEGGFRLTQNFNNPGSGLSRANTFIYEYDFRRVKVAEDTLQVYPAAVPLLAAAVRVGGPGFTWIRDTRDSAVDAHRGTYTSFQEFLSAAPFGAQAQFNRIDSSNSSFYGFDKNKFVLARNTRYGQERAFGSDSARMIPLPERLYAGGSTSLRGFSINAAGPRDPDTGFPIGGAGTLVNSTELRLPPPTLPYFGNSLSFVLFHDMGNVFTNAGDAWSSILHVRQPDRDNCKQLTPPVTNSDGTSEVPLPSGPSTSTGQQGTCSFNYFSHAPGLGLRYHTPVGPIRLDFSYNLNPPIYPVNVDYSKTNPFENQHVGEASHFNFFFSLGQTF